VWVQVVSLRYHGGVKPKKIARIILPGKSIKLAEETYRRSRALALQSRYRFPARDLRIIAVTGTNGKTTTCMLINSMLKSAGYKTAMFTTAVIEVAGKTEANNRHTTVPITADLLRFFRDAKKAEVDYVVLEVTSHALQQHKLRGVPIEVAVLTNLSQDHLDYHGTMEHYAAAKARLFNRYMQPNYCVLNRDDAWFDYFQRQSVGAVITYGQKRGSEALIGGVDLSPSSSKFFLTIDKKKISITTKLVGLFNVYNAAAAAGVGQTLGLNTEKIAKGLAALDLVPGRMQAIDEGQNFTVLVDYAVTPDALQKALQAAHDVNKKAKVHIVFGATGDRDKGKRPLMGQVAAGYADYIYLTDDETYTEDPAVIRKAVMKGITKAGGADKTQEIPDRKEAINLAFKAAKKGDVVLLTGIGHQDYRNMGGKKQPWDERKVAQKLLKKL
jgi:UDP-N-acetylmuramoyl-L-alanyl-D-glutamate--2,6-diaminopimelate ligase